MDKIYITGHKNPDMDSICAAWCYGVLKNKIDPSHNYVPIRCGNLNKQTKAVLENLNVEPPRLVKDIAPQVQDVAKRNIITLEENDPILTAIKELDEKTISLIPVFKNGNDFAGILTINEVTGFLLADNGEGRPRYNFLIDNFSRVLPGYFYRRGKSREFNAMLMTGVMPFDVSVERIKELGQDKPLLVMGLREDLLQYAVDHQFPAIVITGMHEEQTVPVDLANYEGTIYISQTDTAETIRLLRLSAPLKNIIDTDPPRLESSASFDRARDELLKSSLRGLPVFTGDNFEGVVTRRCFIERPRRRLILVDHNELSQSVNGADQADILEIHDHHRLGTIKTRHPIFCNSRPVGSTCTIVFEQFIMNGVEPDKTTALLLLSGILSDTVILKSPTTTETDRRTVEKLCERAGVDYKVYGEQMFSQGLTLKKQKPEDLIFTDYKEYTEQGFSIGIGQLEVLNLDEVSDVKEDLLSCLEKSKKAKNKDWLMLLITNVTNGNSLLLTSAFPRGEENLLYEKREENLYNLPGILSRKKQLLPEILRVLEELKDNG
ncbi:MAG: putative manganese-dependent inorganic diphosphatase [Spirochaetales bacterium]|nr:putative manganese-dependent inorganic diphosphatase [Spirochaetales bacterium]